MNPADKGYAEDVHTGAAYSVEILADGQVIASDRQFCFWGMTVF